MCTDKQKALGTYEINLSSVIKGAIANKQSLNDEGWGEVLGTKVLF